MTVSYTCQKPIKFWAKCKINLLYKLNQPFCVFQAALSSWQQGSGLGPHSSCPWSSTSLFIHKTIPSPVPVPVIFIGHHLVGSFQSYRASQWIHLRGPRKPFLPVIVYVPRRPLPHIIICHEPLWSSLCLLPPFFPGSDSVLFLLKPSAYICCLLF